MATWTPMFALPNIDVEEPIEADGMALVPVDNERIRRLSSRHKRMKQYLRKFGSEFGGVALADLSVARAAFEAVSQSLP